MGGPAEPNSLAGHLEGQLRSSYVCQLNQIVDGSADRVVVRDLTRAWMFAAVFLLLGMALLWWAHQQWEEIRAISSADFVIPQLRMLWFHLTLVVAGVAFGLAVAASRQDAGRPRIHIVGVLALIPIAGLLLFFSAVFQWRELTLPFGLEQFLLSDSTRMALTLLLGFLLSGMIGLGAEKDSPPD